MSKIVDILKDYSNIVFILCGILILTADLGELKKKRLKKEQKAVIIIGISYLIIGFIISFI